MQETVVLGQYLGGVDPTPDQLQAMQAGDYILHVRHGQIHQLAVAKTRMPLDPQGHYQNVGLFQAPDGAIYAVQQTIISKSTDQGRTWEHLDRDPAAAGFGGWLLQANQAGEWVNIAQDGDDRVPTVWISGDEGVSWARQGPIDIAPFQHVEAGASLTRLADGTLLLPIKHRDASFADNTNPTYAFRSTDGGHTFPQRYWLSDYGNETNIAELTPGRQLAVIRYQPGPPDQPHTNKTVFLANSTDGGCTWTGHRQLTTTHGQCHGAAVGLTNDRVVVAYDHRYPRAMGSGRAALSPDGGRSWRDEGYYLCHGHVAGFPRHVALDDGAILTFIGSYYGDVESWENATGGSQMVAISWRPVP